MPNEHIINKSMEFEDLASAPSQKVVSELNSLILLLREKDLKISSWYGQFDLPGDKFSFEIINRGYDYKSLVDAVDDHNFPWFLYWEIAWVFLHAGFVEGQKVLDLGGSSSLFSYYLASKGLDVTTVDLKEHLVDNANSVAKAMNWRLKNYVTDMRSLSFSEQFDHITSICVFEHIPMYDRVKINEKIAELLPRDGRFSITFDYRNPSRFASIDAPEDVFEQFIKPSGLAVRGNSPFYDSGKNYLLHPFFHPRFSLRRQLRHVRIGEFRLWQLPLFKRKNDYTFGALFLEKK